MSMMNSSDSKRRSGVMECVRAALESRFSRFILICLLIVVCCASLVRVAEYQSYMLYDASRVHYAVAAVLAFSTVGLLFVFARFSFGYFAGFYLYTMVLGFIWLSCFTRYNYDHKLAGVSAAISMLLFLLPALLINAPIKQLYALPEQAFERLLRSILVLAVLTIGVASTYNFTIISVDHIYDLRAELSFPTI